MFSLFPSVLITTGKKCKIKKIHQKQTKQLIKKYIHEFLNIFRSSIAKNQSRAEIFLNAKKQDGGLPSCLGYSKILQEIIFCS